MLTLTNPLTIEGYTVYHDDSAEIQVAEGPGSRLRRNAGAAPPSHFYVLPETPTIARDAAGKPIFSLIVYRQDEERIDPARSKEDVGGGILTFTVELAVPSDKLKAIKRKLATMVFGDDPADPGREVELSYVQFLDGKVSVAVAGETAGGDGAEFVKGVVGAGRVSGVGANRKAVMVKLTQSGAALMSQLERLNTLPINVQYELTFEHRLLGVSMRVWCDMNSSYTLIQEVVHNSDDFSSGYLGVNDNHVPIDKVTSVTETLVRSKVAGVQVVPASSQVDAETLASLEKLGFDLLNKEMDKALQAAPPPAELDRAYLEKFTQSFGSHFNFSLDRRMVLVQNFNPSANIANVLREGDMREMVAFIDLRTAFFSFLKIPVRVNTDFGKLPLDSVTVTVTYQRQRFDGSGRETRTDSFNFTDGSAIQTFFAFANSLADVAYDWQATVHYKGSHENYSFGQTGVRDDFLVIDVGALGMIQVDLGLGLVDLEKFPAARVSVRYRSRALGRTLEQNFLLDKDKQTALWTDVIREEPKQGYEYKVDWLRKRGDDRDILEGQWQSSSAGRLRFDAPVPDQLDLVVVCTGNFKDGPDRIAEVAVSLRYSDPANAYTEEGHLVFTAENQQLPWKVDLRNPSLRDYEYKYAIIYADGLVKNQPENGGWLKGDPGFITVGEKYTLEVELFPTLLAYPDNAKLVQVNLSYDDAAAGIHVSDSFVFSKEAANAPRSWRVRGAPGGPRRYLCEILYFSTTGAIITLPATPREAPALVIPPPPPVAAPTG